MARNLILTREIRLLLNDEGTPEKLVYHAVEVNQQTGKKGAVITTVLNEGCEAMDLPDEGPLSRKSLKGIVQSLQARLKADRGIQ